MFAANPSDPSLSYTIRYIDLPENAVPYPRRSRRARRLVGVAAGVGILAVALATGVGASHPAADFGFPGEFRLGPGNGQPVGYVVPGR